MKKKTEQKLTKIQEQNCSNTKNGSETVISHNDEVCSYCDHLITAGEVHVLVIKYRYHNDCWKIKKSEIKNRFMV